MSLRLAKMTRLAFSTPSSPKRSTSRSTRSSSGAGNWPAGAGGTWSPKRCADPHRGEATAVSTSYLARAGQLGDCPCAPAAPPPRCRPCANGDPVMRQRDMRGRG